MPKVVKSHPMEFAKRAFSADIQASRIDAKMSISDVADYVGLSDTTVSHYESGNEGNMHIENFLKLCNLFDLDPRAYFILEG